MSGKRAPPPNSNCSERARLIASEEGFAGENIQIDDDAKINRAERGSWISAWVWVEDELARSDLDDECNGGSDDLEPLM